jgi:hypothetical protein
MGIFVWIFFFILFAIMLVLAFPKFWLGILAVYITGMILGLIAKILE